LPRAGAGAQRHRGAEATSGHGHTGAAARARGAAEGGAAAARRAHGIGFRFDAAAPQLVKKGHQLLVTLLLMNAAAMEVRQRQLACRAAAAPPRCASCQGRR
jgi:hypothetical protein